MIRSILAAIALAVLTQAAPPRPDRTAVDDLLARAVTSLGGSSRIQQQALWVVEGKGRENTSAELQGERYGVPTWRPHEERFAVDTRELATSWERRTPRNDGTVRWRRFISRRDSSGSIDWNFRRGSESTTGAPEEPRRAMARRFPHLLLSEAAAHAQLRSAGRRRIDGLDAYLVEAVFPEATPVTLVLAGDPLLLRGAEYRVHLPGAGDVLVSWTWHGWTADPELGFRPKGHRLDIDGAIFQEVEYTAYGPDAAQASELLAIPRELLEGGGPARSAAATPSSGFPLTGEVAPGVHVFNLGGFVVMAIDMGDYLIAVEAPERHPRFETLPPPSTGPSLTRQFIEQLKTAFPAKPVRFAVITHHHSDHMGGVIRYAEAGATILVADADRAAAVAALRRPHDLSADPAKPVPAAAVEGVARERVIQEGDRVVRIINVPDNPHTAANLMVWIPGPRVLFQGDLFYYSEGQAFPPAGRHVMNRSFAEWLAARDIAPRMIYGVHNRGAAGEPQLRQSLAPDAKGASRGAQR